MCVIMTVKSNIKDRVRDVKDWLGTVLAFCSRFAISSEKVIISMPLKYDSLSVMV